MRLTYITSYKDQGGKEAVLHRQAPAVPGRPSWHKAACVFSRWEARPATLVTDLICSLARCGLRAISLEARPAALMIDLTPSWHSAACVFSR